MSGPAQFGAIVYAKNLRKLAGFYIDYFDMNLVRETGDFLSLEKNGINIIIHTPPIELSDSGFNRVKLFLTVDSLEKARNEVTRLGGTALEGEWANPLFRVCNIADPEGNHIQLREFTR